MQMTRKKRQILEYQQTGIDVAVTDILPDYTVSTYIEDW